MKKAFANYLPLCIGIALGTGSHAVYGQTASSGANNSASDTEVIQVRGIRGSLTQALATKRMSNSVLDSISAEDIGDFPDKNIGDALQRIPGVTVSRGFGEVDGVNIRGTSPQQSMVLLNGQNVASVGWFDLGGFKRSFNFELISSEQIAGLDVYKSAEAEINEGAMGGTINLKTRKPLDMDANTFFGSVEGSHNKNSDGWEPGFSGLYSWKNQPERFGVLLAYSVEKQDVVRETLSSFATPQDFSALNVVDSDGNVPILPIGMASIIFDERRKRESAQASVQFQATDELTFSLDYNKFTLTNPHINTAMFAFFHHNAVIDAASRVVNDKGVTVAGDVSAVSQDSGLVPMFNNSVIRDPKMESDVLNLTVDYEGENWDLSAVVGQSGAKSRGMQSSTWWGNQADKSRTGFSFDISGPHIMTPTHSDYVMDHSQQQLYQEFSYLNNVRDHDIDYYQVDYSYRLEEGIFTSIDTGLKYQEQTFSASQHTYDNGLLARGMEDGLTLNDFNGGTVSGLHSKEGRPGTLTAFAVLNESIWQYAESNKGPLQIIKWFSVDEEITSAYVKGNFETDTIRGNVGLRYVDTDVLSRGTSDGTPQGDALQGSKSYREILPSLNVVMDVNDDLLLRFAAGSTLSRPDYDQMQMLTDITIHQRLATIGSPDIEPYTSDQFDLGVEWYFDASSLLSATLFYKDISDYIEQTTETESITGCDNCQVTRYRNVGTAEVTGLELQYQQDFGNGFGAQLNYTYTDSELVNAAGVKAPLFGVSENSFNAAAYYENEQYSARIAFNHRDEWTFNNNGATATADSYSQVDASFVWHLNENIDISLEGINLFNEAKVGRLPEYNVVHSVDEFGTRYYVGASFRY